MTLRRLLTVALVAVALAMPAAAHAKKVAASAKASVKKPAKKAKLVCKGKGAKRKCKRVRGPSITSRKVADADLRTAPLPRPSGRIVIEVPALRQSLDVNIYNDDGSYNQAALAALDNLWVCKKTREVRAVDPRLYEVLSTIYDHYGKPVALMSGFRFQRNEGSRHFHASAMDIRIAGVSYKELYKFAETLDTGGMGIGEYPNLDFVHIDFRAPGERSTRWTDRGGVNNRDPGKLPSRAWKRKPNS